MKSKEVIPVIPPKDIIIGDKDAAVKITMFGDYESEESDKANSVIAELLETYKGRINFVFRHFPMTRIHQKAHKAAEAAIGAAQEGKFWEMHQYLFAHKRNLGVISLKSYAREVGVTDKKFLDHLINSDWGWNVQDDLREGIERGVKEIPAIFINGDRLEKEPTSRNLKQAIETQLSKEIPISSGKIRKRA
ncbi:MAG TPA: thioredoxin domain-containing protein [Flavisolibacter sp.]|nr:thioredoxin domain-containing protein [Flavisolibacter sp.]